jgi:uncharacterized iron-regulated membrane protein
MRRKIKKIHLYIALIFFLPLSIQGLSGMALVFADEISNYLISKNYHPTQGNPHSTQEIIEATSSIDGADAKVVLIKFDEKGWTKLRFASGLEIVVDPISLEVISQKNLKEDFFYNLKKFHSNLLVDKSWSHNFIGLVGISLLFLAISGIIIWWPKNREKFYRSIQVDVRQKGYVFWKELHKMLGFWGFIIVLSSSVSGIYLVFKSPPAKVEVVEGKNKISINELEKIAKNSLVNENLKAEEIKISAISFPQKPNLAYRFNFSGAGVAALPTTVFVDQYLGEVKSIRDPKSFGVIEKTLALQHSIHSGEIFGIMGRILIFLVGMTPLIFTISGLNLWWMKKKRPS